MTELRMKTCVIIIVTFILTSGIACGSPATSPDSVTDATVRPTALLTPTSPSTSPLPSVDRFYRNVSEGFEVLPPDDWIVDESGIFGTSVVFLNQAPNFHEGHPFAANINVITEVASGYTLEEYVEHSYSTASSVLTDFQLLEEFADVVDGKEIRYAKFSHRQGVFPLRGCQAIVSSGSKFYVVTATTLESDWNDYEEILNLSLRSVRLLE